MLLREQPDGSRLAIGQASHAWVSGQLARAWGNERFGTFEPREAVCLGAALHDIGMSEWDLAPTLNSDTGLPHSFMEMPLATHLELWSHAHTKVLSQSAYAALLVSMHGAALYEMRDLSRMSDEDAAAVRAFLVEQRAVQGDLRRLLGADDDAAAERNQRLLWTWDWLSLALLLGWAPDSLDGVPAAGGEAVTLSLEAGEGGVARLEPWPFAADAVTLSCEGRRLEPGYGDEEEMRAALKATPVEPLTFELAAG